MAKDKKTLTPVQKAQDALAVNQKAVAEQTEVLRKSLLSVTGGYDAQSMIRKMNTEQLMDQFSTISEFSKPKSLAVGGAAKAVEALKPLLKEEKKLLTNLRNLAEKEAKVSGKKEEQRVEREEKESAKQQADLKAEREKQSKTAFEKMFSDVSDKRAASAKAASKTGAAVKKAMDKSVSKAEKGIEARTREVAEIFGTSPEDKKSIRLQLRNAKGDQEALQDIMYERGSKANVQTKMAAYQLLLENGTDLKLPQGFASNVTPTLMHKIVQTSLRLPDNNVNRGFALQQLVNVSIGSASMDVVLKEFAKPEHAPSKCSDAKLKDMMNAVMLVQESKSATKDQKSAADDLVSKMFKEQLSRQKQVDDGKKLGDKAPKNFDITRMLDVLEHMDSAQKRDALVKDMAANLGKGNLSQVVNDKYSLRYKKEIVTGVVDRYSKAGRIGELKVNDLMNIVTNEYVDPKVCGDMFQKNASYFAKNQVFMNQMISQANAGNPLAQDGLKTMMETLKGKEFNAAFNRVVDKLDKTQLANLMLDPKIQDKAMKAISEKDFITNPDLVSKVEVACFHQGQPGRNMMAHLVSELDKNKQYKQLSNMYDQNRGGGLAVSEINKMMQKQSLSIDAFIKLRADHGAIVGLQPSGNVKNIGNNKYDLYNNAVARLDNLKGETKSYVLDDYARLHKEGGKELAAFDHALEVVYDKETVKKLKIGRSEHVKAAHKGGDPKQEYLDSITTKTDKLSMKVDSAKDAVQYAAHSAKSTIKDIIHRKRNAEVEELIKSQDDIWNKKPKGVDPRASGVHDVMPSLTESGRPVVDEPKSTVTADVSTGKKPEGYASRFQKGVGKLLSALTGGGKDKPAHKAILEEGPKGSKADEVKAAKAEKGSHGRE